MTLTYECGCSFRVKLLFGPDPPPRFRFQQGRTLELVNREPNIYVIDGFLSPAEVEHFVQLTKGKVRRIMAAAYRAPLRSRNHHTIGPSHRRIVDIRLMLTMLTLATAICRLQDRHG